MSLIAFKVGVSTVVLRFFLVNLFLFYFFKGIVVIHFNVIRINKGMDMHRARKKMIHNDALLFRAKVVLNMRQLSYHVSPSYLVIPS